VQVVLGEGEPGMLRFVLEAEGFHVVGQARGEDELRRVLAVTSPAVIVLDAGISASAALDARQSSGGASVVVVWPTGVVAAVADERVDPATVMHDLGGAVRRAAARTSPREVDDITITLPEAAPTAPVIPLHGELEEDRTRPRPRRHRLLVVAATWTIVLGASAAIGLTIPRAFERVEPPSRSPRTPAISPTATIPSRPHGDRAEQQSPAGSANAKECERAVPTGQRSEREKPDDPGRRCGNGDGQAKDRGANGKSGGEQGKGEGRPDDPGANGNRPDDPGAAGNRPDDAGQAGAPEPKNDSSKQRPARSG
jgi:hypothetical protein